MDAEKITEVLDSAVSELGLSFASNGRRSELPDELRRILSANAAELARLGLPKAAWEPAIELLADVVETVVSVQRLVAKGFTFGCMEASSNRLVKEAADFGRVDLDQIFSPEIRERFFALSTTDKEAIQPPEWIWDQLLRPELAIATREALELLSDFPFDYVLSVRTPLPGAWWETLGSLEKVGAATLETTAWSEVLPDEVAMHGVVESQAEKQQRLAPDDACYYLTSEYFGFLALSPAPVEQPVVELRQTLKSLVGLCIATELLVLSERPNWDHAEPVIVFENSRGTGRKLHLRWLPPEESAVMGAISPASIENDNHRRHLKKYGGWVIAALNDPASLVPKAGRWFFDSLCGSNHLLQLVQAITALEILFGEHDEKTRLRSSLGVGELLANRYAYSVATGPARKAAAKEFKTVYEARSRVVHSGSDNVDPEVLRAARRMCMRAITHELTVLSEA